MAQTGSPQLARLRELDLAPGQLGMWWLGQAGFAVNAAGRTVLIDPWLSDYPSRRFAPPLPPDQATGVDAILCTHEHIDHLDGKSIPALAAASPEARIVVPRPIVSMVTGLGVDADRVTGSQPDEPVDLGGVTIHPVPARHGIEVGDAYTFGQELSDGLYRYLGFVVEANGARVYHAGDTILFDGMETLIKNLGVDVALLPINGRDGMREARGIVGNLNEREAAWLAAEAGVRTLIPMHYEMFAHNRGYPAKVLEAIDQEGWKVDVLVPGTDHPFVCALSYPETNGTIGRR